MNSVVYVTISASWHYTNVSNVENLARFYHNKHPFVAPGKEDQTKDYGIWFQTTFILGVYFMHKVRGVFFFFPRTKIIVFITNKNPALQRIDILLLRKPPLS